MPGTVKFCSYCGDALQVRDTGEDTAAVLWCSRCQCAHYHNPTILVAAFLHCQDKLLWARRGIAPGAGKWAFPAGYAECGESLQQAAARELFEETRIVVRPEQLVPMSISSIIAIDQIYVVFRCPCATEIAARTTRETLEWAWLRRDQAPWTDMAHEQSRPLVEQVYDALESQRFFMRVGQMDADGNHHQSYLLGPAVRKT